MLKAILFDMDGTITCPHIDWHALRQRVGAPQGVPIMEYADSLSNPQKERAHALVEAAEMEAAEQAVLNPGARELLVELRAYPLRLALVTNNNRKAMRTIVDKFRLDFDLLLSREDAPLKPAPDLVLRALERFKLAPTQACFVGDGTYDRLASQAAGVPYIHLAHDRDTAVTGPTIHALDELWDYIKLDGAASGRCQNRQ
jgi:HAD superfamily hydrolase (TIGR01509 family)